MDTIGDDAETLSVLFLDDNGARASTFRKRFATDLVDIDWAESAGEAIRMLNGEVHGTVEYDVVWLDHDLSEWDQGLPLGSDTKEITGMAVVDHITSMPESRRNFMVVVHTLNEPAAKEMCRRLRSVGMRVRRVPFTHVNLSSIRGDM